MLLLLAGCVGTVAADFRDRLIHHGYPVEYADGYAAGLETGHRAYGNPYASFVQDESRYLWDPKYKLGWDDGYVWGEHSNSSPTPISSWVPLRRFDADALAVPEWKHHAAIVMGNEPKRFSHGDEESVFLISADTPFSDSPERFGARLVASGTSRIVVGVLETHWLAFLHSRPGIEVTLPAQYHPPPRIEVTLLAQHRYVITAKKVDEQHVVQFWDVTKGADNRTLVKEFSFDDGTPVNR
jgi:hypothetical protein